MDLEKENKKEENRNNSSNHMSVSVPNLTSNQPPRPQHSDISVQKPLAETYSPYQKHRNFDRNNSHNNQNQVTSHISQRVPTSVSSLVRLALSTNFPSMLSLICIL